MSTFTCSICHEEKEEDEQAFLDNCFHYICLPCAREWTRVQRKAHHRQEPNATFKPQCPLCKASYDSIIFDYADQSFRQEWVADGAHGSSLSSHAFILSPLQRKRRSFYFLPEEQPRRDLPFKVATSWQKLVGRSEVAVWLERELQALVLQADVRLIHSVVTSAMLAAPQEEEPWCNTVARETAAFLGERAHRFARELRRFVASGMTVRSYDRHTDVMGQNREAAQPALPLDCKPPVASPQASGDEAIDAGASSNSEQDPAGSDSEGYDDLLLNAARRHASTQSGDIPIIQDTKKRRTAGDKSSKKERRKRARGHNERTKQDMSEAKSKSISSESGRDAAELC